MKEKPAIFILKVLALSLFLYVLWYWKGESYWASMMDNFFKHFFSTLGIRAKVFRYPEEIFNNLIPFLSLMLFTKDIQLKSRISKLVIGLLILIGAHILLFFGLYLLYHDYQVPPSELYNKLSVPLYLFSQTLPFLLWIILAKRNLLSLFIPKKMLATK